MDIDWIKIIELAEETITKQGLNKAKLPEILGINSQYLTDIRTKKKKSPGPKFALSLVTKLNFNPSWLETGKGSIFNPPLPEKHPLILDLEAIVDQRLEKLEAQIAEIQGQLKQKGINDPDSVLFTSESEPEYDEDPESIALVEGIAAGKPIYQSDVRSTIKVPKRYIKTKPEDYFAGRIKGTSMTNAGIPDGCMALFRISDVPRNGAIQIVEWQGEATIKRMREVPGKGWKICFEDGTKRYIEVGPGEEPRIQGDFVAVLPEE
jgi:SOS-response transcriptional repressor LexA